MKRILPTTSRLELESREMGSNTICIRSSISRFGAVTLAQAGSSCSSWASEYSVNKRRMLPRTSIAVPGSFTAGDMARDVISANTTRPKRGSCSNSPRPIDCDSRAHLFGNVVRHHRRN